MKNNLKNWWTYLALIMLFAAATSTNSLYAQGDIIGDDDDDEEMEVEEDDEWELVKYDEALVTLNGVEQAISEDFEVERNQTLSIKIERLKPGSWLAVHIKKAGATIQKHRWTSNERGELELEVKSGKRKVKGSAEIWYTPSNGQKKNLSVSVKVI